MGGKRVGRHAIAGGRPRKHGQKAGRAGPKRPESAEKQLFSHVTGGKARKGGFEKRNKNGASGARAGRVDKRGERRAGGAKLNGPRCSHAQ